MGTQKLFAFGTHFNSVIMGFAGEFLYQKLVLFFRAFWFSVATYLLPLFDFISTYVSRFKRNVSSSTNTSEFSKFISEESNKNDLSPIEPEIEAEQDVSGFSDSENDGVGEKESPNFAFKFKFPTYEELSKSRGNRDMVDDGFLSDMDFKQVDSKAEAIHEKLSENSTNGVCGEKIIEKSEIDEMTFTEVKGQMENLQGDQKDSSTVSDPESTRSNNLHSVRSCLVDSYSDGFLSDGDFGGEFELDSLIEINGQKIESHHEMSDSDENYESEDFDDEDSDIMEELRNLEENHLGNLDVSFLSEKDFNGELDTSKNGEFCGKDDNLVNGADNFEKQESKDSSVFDSEDTTLWEHEELIKQLKMELKKVRGTGLPTILEESESPKIMEDLKPWKMEEKFHHENPMDELQKVYKSYKERMRKFDILNYQKMYAIGFLQLKDPTQSISTHKSSVPEIISLLPQNFSLYKSKKNKISDPKLKFIHELQSDLEMVYVGQMCLSWEILHWQYGKALNVWESDPRGIHRFNEVAGEFQQFQVLMQRFIEDEPFQGPRFQNYVKNRCVLRNLLQVPVIREDSSKDRKKARSERGDYVVTSDMLVEIMEESIRIFWRFVRADKDCTSTVNIIKGQRRALVELQDPADFELLMELRKNLQKVGFNQFIHEKSSNVTLLDWRQARLMPTLARRRGN